MNVNDVRKQLAALEKTAKEDDESAHSAQDKLYLAVLQAIARGETSTPRALAIEAIKADDIKFERWYA